jgi:hypothetical protein
MHLYRTDEVGRLISGQSTLTVKSQRQSTFRPCLNTLSLHFLVTAAVFIAVRTYLYGSSLLLKDIYDNPCAHAYALIYSHG